LKLQYFKPTPYICFDNMFSLLNFLLSLVYKDIFFLPFLKKIIL